MNAPIHESYLGTIGRLVCVNRSASAHDLFKANGALCVNVLAGASVCLDCRIAQITESGWAGSTPEAN